jgi:hypothetical protein
MTCPTTCGPVLQVVTPACASCPTTEVDTLLIKTRHGWLCVAHYVRWDRPGLGAQKPLTVQEQHERQTAIRERMSKRGGNSRYMVRKGGT